MYNPHNWVSEEIITADKLNNIETGVQNTEKEIETIRTLAKGEKGDTGTVDNAGLISAPAFQNLQSQVTKQLAEVEIDKADKTQVWNMANMGQDVKTAMTGGSVAVTGTNAVDFVNLNASMQDKLGELKLLNLEFLVGYYDNDADKTTITALNTYRTIETSCMAGEIYNCDVYVAAASMSKAVFWNAAGAKIGYLDLGVTGQFNNFQFIIPENCVKVTVTSNISLGSYPVLRKFIAIDIKDKINALDSEYGAAIFSDKFTQQDIAVQTGYYDKDKTVLAVNPNYRTIETACTPGEIYNCDTYVASSATAIVILWSGSVHHSYLGLGSIGQHAAYEFTIPSGVSKLSVTSNISLGSYPILRKSISVNRIEELEKSPSKKNLIVKYDGSGIVQIKRKLDSDNDLMIDFRKCGVNNTPNIYGVYKVLNSEKLPSTNFTAAETLLTSGTDFLGPYVVSAKNNIDGDSALTGYFTGGWHGYDGNISATPSLLNATSTNLSFSVYADGNLVGNEIAYGDYIKLEFENLVQASNTKKADGTGRGVLKEHYTIIITPDRGLEVECEITILEDVFIKTYYGLQSNYSNVKTDGKLLLIDGVGSYTKDTVVYDIAKNYVPMASVSSGDILFTAGSKENGSRCNKVKVKSDIIKSEMSLKEPIKYTDYVPTSFDGLVLFSGYGKIYFTQIKDTDFTANTVLNWVGGYKFYK